MRKRRPSSWCARISRLSPLLLTNSFSLRISNGFYFFFFDIVYLVVVCTSMKFCFSSYENEWRKATAVSIVVMDALSDDRCVFDYVICRLRQKQYDNHGGPFFGETAIFTVLNSLAVRDGLCIVIVHVPNSAALCPNQQYSIRTQ